MMKFPFSIPQVLFIDPCGKCNFNCVYCPCNNNNRKFWSECRTPRIMTLNEFDKIIRNSKFETPIKKLCLYKEGEPFLNKHLPEMVKHAKKNDFAENICTVTNGSLLNEKTIDALLEAGLDEICISIPGISDDDYKSIARVDISFFKIKKYVQYLRNCSLSCKIIIKVIDTNYNDAQKKTIIEELKDICDTIIFNPVRPIWPGFNVNEVLHFDSKISEDTPKEICSEIFTSLVVNSNGSVSACCVDWNWELIIGNALEESLLEIWNGEKANLLRRAHLSLNRKIYSPCSQCITLCESNMNLEPIRNILLKRMKEKGTP